MQKILVCALFLNCFLLSAQDSTSVVNVSIERGSNKTSFAINLIVENMMSEDTLFIASKYFIDEYYPPNRIFIYSCKKLDSADSIQCDWGYSHGDIAPTSISFSKERVIKISPKEKIILKMPLSHYYIGDEIFLEIRMVCSKGREGRIFLLTKTTNKILFEKEPDEYEKYQMKKNEERANEIKNNKNSESSEK